MKIPVSLHSLALAAVVLLGSTGYPLRAHAGDQEDVAVHVSQFARLASALQRYERALQRSLDRGMNGVSAGSARLFGNSLHKIRVDAWDSLAKNPRSPIRRVETTFQGDQGRHVFRLEGDDRWEFWIEKTIPRPGTSQWFRADTVVVDLHEKKIWVEDVTARSINDPDLGNPQVYDRDRGSTAAHWAHNHERARALSTTLGPEWTVFADTPEEAHYRTMAMKNIRARQTQSLTVDINRRNGASRMQGFVGGVMINFLISRFTADETASNRYITTLTNMYEAYITGDMARAQTLRGRWDSGADGALFFKNLVGDEAVALTLFESTNELVRMIEDRINADRRAPIEGEWWGGTSTYRLSQNEQGVVVANFERVSPELAENYGYQPQRLAWRGRRVPERIEGRADPVDAPTREGMRMRYPQRFREACESKWEKYVEFELTIVSDRLLFGFRPAYAIDSTCKETARGIAAIMFVKRDEGDGSDTLREEENQ